MSRSLVRGSSQYGKYRGLDKKIIVFPVLRFVHMACLQTLGKTVAVIKVPTARWRTSAAAAGQ
ncbi:hypothetical protein HYFRA_00000849 [Hymenoscyphus fraxineus]|uniref:Uncharacterized protein n=1 Tax=Hymenoscyphus fraxineus TaxID=746836 RepID=A0A9N9KS44_9HELO|nr:hypothetical protein HYFRA_00000849 [Hymenoscyphus fraxineus]